jgi:RND family efflux transporter MFP subunit
MKRYKIFIFVVLIATGLALIASCSSKSSSSSNNQSSQIVKVTRGNLETDITPTGNLLMPHQTNLTFGSSGTVAEVLVQMGDTVKEGQELAELDTTSLQAALIQAKISVEQAEMSLEQAETPTTNSSGTTVISAPDPLNIEIKQFQLDQAKLNQQDAQKALDNATMVAPYDGWIGAVNISVGDIVNNNTAAIQIIDPTQLEVDVLINEMDINNVKVGTPARVQITSIPGTNLTATAFAISPTATVQNGVVNYLVKLNVQPPKPSGGAFFNRGQTASVTTNARNASASTTTNAQNTAQNSAASTTTDAQNASALTTTSAQNTSASTTTNAQNASASTPVIREGMSTTITIITAQSQNALLLPISAVIRQGRNTVVQLLNSDGKVEQRTIQTGLSNWQYVEVTSGLNEGDQVMLPETTSATSSQSSTTSTNTNPSPQQNRMFRSGGVLR